GRELRPNAVAGFLLVEVDHRGKKRLAERQLDERVADINARLEAERLRARRQRRLRLAGTADTAGHLEDARAATVRELRGSLLAGIRGELARGTLQKEAGDACFLLHERRHGTWIVGRELVQLALEHGGMRGEVHGVRDRFAVGILDAQYQQRA